jgi:hypothetical protein
MARAAHSVQRIVVELRNSNSDTYKADEADFSNILNDRLAQLIEEVCEDAGVSSSVIRIDKLEIDLGRVKRPFNANEIFSVIRKKLKEQIASVTESLEQQEKPVEHEELETLIYFLENGILPWWANELPEVSRFRDREFLAGFITFLRLNSDTKIVTRLIKQFDQIVVYQILDGLVSDAGKETLQLIKQLSSDPPENDRTSARRFAQIILESAFRAAIEKNGSIGTISELALEYLDPAQIPQDLLLNESDAELKKELILLAKTNAETSAVQQPLASPAEPVNSLKKTLVVHFLDHGSLPREAWNLQKNEIDQLMVEFIATESSFIGAQIQKLKGSRYFLETFLRDLPEFRFRELIERMVRRLELTSSPFIASGKTGGFDLMDHLHDLRHFASSIFVEKLLIGTALSAQEIFWQVAADIPAREYSMLRPIFGIPEIDQPGKTDKPEFPIEPSASDFSKEGIRSDDVNGGSEGVRKKTGPDAIPERSEWNVFPEKPEAGAPSAVFFGDLLHYLISFQNWPWWAEHFTTWFGVDTDKETVGHIVSVVIGKYEKLHPKTFELFAQTFFASQKAPVVALTKLPWPATKKIIDRIFPSEKNPLSDTVIAILDLLKSQKGFQINSSVLTQHLLFSELAHSAGKIAEFKTVLSRFVTMIAAHLQIPLWEIYNLLQKNYRILALKKELSKENVITLFQYSADSEDIYTELQQRSNENADANGWDIDNILFHTGQTEEMILSFVSGEGNFLQIFPSAWALNDFMIERLKNSSGFSAVLKQQFSTDKIARKRILMLEEISSGEWVGKLLLEPDQQEMLQDLSRALKNSPLELFSNFRSLLLSAFIEADLRSGLSSIEKLQRFISNLSSETGLSKKEIQAYFISRISDDGVAFPKLRALMRSPADGYILDGDEIIENAKETTPSGIHDSFASKLREVELRKKLSGLQINFYDLNDQSIVLRMIADLLHLTSRTQILTWIKKELKPDEQVNLMSLVYDSTSEGENGASLSIQKSFLLSVLKTRYDRLAFETSFGTLLKLSKNITDIEFLQADPELLAHGASKETILQKLDSVKGEREKKILLKFVSENFPVSGSTVAETALNDLVGWNISLSGDDQKTVKTDLDDMLQSLGITTGDEAVLLAEETYEPEFIVDITVHLFQFAQMPWWSPIKDERRLMKLLRGISEYDVEQLRQKLLEISKVDTGFHEAVMENLETAGIDSNTSTIQNDKAVLLEPDLDFLSAVLLTESRFEFLRTYIDKVASLVTINGELNGEVRTRFRRIMVQIFSVVEPKSLHAIKNAEILDEPVEDWAQSIDAAEFREFVRRQSIQGIMRFLRFFEDQFYSGETKPGFFVSDHLALTIEDDKLDPGFIVDSWLTLLSGFKQIAAETIKLKILENVEATSQELTPETLEAIQLLRNSEPIETVLLPPYSHYLLALRLVLERMPELGSQQSAGAIELFDRLLRSEKMLEGRESVFELLFTFLEQNGISRHELIQATSAAKQTKNESHLAEIFSVFIRMAEDTDRLEKLHRELNGAATKNRFIPETALPTIVDAIRKLVQDALNDRIMPGNLIDGIRKEPFITGEEQEIPKPQKPLNVDGRIYIPNAGLILLWPFLTRLFKNLNYLENNQFVDPEKQIRAVHLTQYIVGFTENHPEHTLPLNKLLCGLNLDTPLEKIIYLTKEEKQEGRNLVAAVLQQWKEMSNTSSENFQRTFLQRSGVLFQKDENWTLVVDHKPLDILLLKLPWGLSMVKYPWNNYLIFVEWKAMN